jgi:hypothetical protein
MVRIVAAQIRVKHIDAQVQLKPKSRPSECTERVSIRNL